jgi:hypothetical protein
MLRPSTFVRLAATTRSPLNSFPAHAVSSRVTRSESHRVCNASIITSRRGFATASTPRVSNISSKPAPRSEQSAKLRRALAVAFFSGASVATFYLGTWQYQRYYWKINLIEERSARLESTPMHFTSLSQLDAMSEGAIQRVVCRGTFDYSRQMICGPRSAPRGVQTSSAIRATGFNVITPLVSDLIFVLLYRLFVSSCSMKRFSFLCNRFVDSANTISNEVSCRLVD